MLEMVKIFKIVVVVLILSIITGCNILTGRMLFLEESNDAYTYEEGHPFHALGRNISDDLRQERSIETNYKDILHGDVIMESQLHSNSGEWSNSKLENYADVFYFLHSNEAIYVHGSIHVVDIKWNSSCRGFNVVNRCIMHMVKKPKSDVQNKLKIISKNSYDNFK